MTGRQQADPELRVSMSNHRPTTIFSAGFLNLIYLRVAGMVDLSTTYHSRPTLWQGSRKDDTPKGLRIVRGPKAKNKSFHSGYAHQTYNHVLSISEPT